MATIQAESMKSDETDEAKARAAATYNAAADSFDEPALAFWNLIAKADNSRSPLGVRGYSSRGPLLFGKRSRVNVLIWSGFSIHGRRSIRPRRLRSCSVQAGSKTRISRRKQISRRWPPRKTGGRSCSGPVIEARPNNSTRRHASGSGQPIYNC